MFALVCVFTVYDIRCQSQNIAREQGDEQHTIIGNDGEQNGRGLFRGTTLALEALS